MKPQEIKNIMTNDLGIAEKKLSELMGTMTATVELLLTGELIASGDHVLRLHELKNIYAIPRIKIQEIKDIVLSADMCINLKAEKIQRFDYMVACRESDGYTKNLMDVSLIAKHLEDRLIDGIDRE